MFLELAHTKLDVFKASREFTHFCYKETKNFPSEEMFAITQQIRRAALSVHLNIAEGSSRRSAVERRRFYEIARGSLVEVDTAFDIAEQLNYTTHEKLLPIGAIIIKLFQMLSKMIAS